MQSFYRDIGLSKTKSRHTETILFAYEKQRFYRTFHVNFRLFTKNSIDSREQ